MKKKHHTLKATSLAIPNNYDEARVLLFQNIKENRHAQLLNPHYCYHAKSCNCTNRNTRSDFRNDDFEIHINSLTI
jgi:hypothetical protein